MRALQRFGALLAAALVAGCGSAADEDLASWMTAQRAATRPHITPIAEPKQFRPADYTEANATDPFTAERLTQALRRDTPRNAANEALIAPELQRRKEPLEAFPLDAMAMVGSMTRGGRPVGLVSVNNMLYQVRVGEHLGQNYGRITRISEGEITLREIVSDTAGEWIERTASLQLQEKAK